MNGTRIANPGTHQNKHYAAKHLGKTKQSKLLYLTEGAKMTPSCGLNVSLQLLVLYHDKNRSVMSDARACAEGMVPLRIDQGVQAKGNIEGVGAWAYHHGQQPVTALFILSAGPEDYRFSDECLGASQHRRACSRQCHLPH